MRSVATNEINNFDMLLVAVSSGIKATAAAARLQKKACDSIKPESSSNE